MYHRYGTDKPILLAEATSVKIHIKGSWNNYYEWFSNYLLLQASLEDWASAAVVVPGGQGSHLVYLHQPVRYVPFGHGEQLPIAYITR